MSDPFPRWSEPATKGDVIRAIVYIQGLVVNLRGELAAITSGSSKDARIASDAYEKAFAELGAVLSDISGRKED